MLTSLGSEEGVPANSATQPAAGLLSIAGDALALAVAALRLGPDPATAAAAAVSAASAPSSRRASTFAPAPTKAPAEAAPAEAAPAPQDVDLPEISLAQVAWHDHINDCWLVVYDRVYDLTNFLWQHPGGEEILLDYAGRDATLAFAGIGHGVSMLAGLQPYIVGRLPESERIYSDAAAQRGVLQLLGLS